MADEVPAERAARLFDPAVGRELDQVFGLVLVEVVALDQAELDGGGSHPLLEVVGVEGEPVAEELDHVVLAGGVVRFDRHSPKDSHRAVRLPPYLDRAMYEGTWTISPCPHGEAGVLAQALGVSETTARVLVRRGYETPEDAKAFLAGALPGHDPFLLGDMAGAVETIKAAIAGGKRICVHGDYDADGICATALAVLILRELGANVEWHLPSRFEEGYGLQRETLARLADEGCGLILTVDCGVTAVEEVAQARARGLDVVVTDHHRPGETLPDCPVVATRPSDYPFPELCGTGVVYKLGEALLGPDSELLARHLDLVALATISDVVPLVDENRALALAGLRALARTQKPGLRALMKAARSTPLVSTRARSGSGSRPGSTPRAAWAGPAPRSIFC